MYLTNMILSKKYDSFIAISHESLELRCLVSNVNLNVQTSFQVFYCMCFWDNLNFQLDRNVALEISGEYLWLSDQYQAQTWLLSSGLETICTSYPALSQSVFSMSVIFSSTNLHLCIQNYSISFNEKPHSISFISSSLKCHIKFLVK